MEEIRKEFEELKEITSLGEEDIEEEIEEKMKGLESRVEKEEIKTYLSGKYDVGDAIIEIFSGAGGKDAEDWAAMLLRMYRRYLEKKGFSSKIINQSYGEGSGPDGRIGIRSVTLEVEGLYAYGYLKRESGTHRLVRQSPFSEKGLRHTSFAAVEVLPKISPKEEEEIKEEDLKVETFRSSGPGGQHVNMRDTAVRVTHLPSKITASCQSERSQGKNKEKAMDLLRSKIYKKREEEEKEKFQSLKEGALASWGDQIRNYVLHPYNLVKDSRTGVETSDTESVLEGDLDLFIEAQIKL